MREEPHKQAPECDACAAVNESSLSAYRRRVLAQDEEWLAGRSRHNDIDDECCADFSCCVPALYEQNRWVRLEMVNDQRERYGLPRRPADA